MPTMPGSFRKAPALPADDDQEIAGVVLAQLSDLVRAEAAPRAEHVREVLTGYRSGHSELAQPGEPRPEFDPQLPMEAKYAAKAAELAVTDRTIKRWVRAYRQLGVAGLADEHADQPPRTDSRWIETALEVMVEHTDQSRPSRTMVIDRTNARVAARHRIRRGQVSQPGYRTSDPCRVGEAPPDLPVEYQAEPGHRRSSERSLREAAPDPDLVSTC